MPLTSTSSSPSEFTWCHFHILSLAVGNTSLLAYPSHTVLTRLTGLATDLKYSNAHSVNSVKRNVYSPTGLIFNESSTCLKAADGKAATRYKKTGFKILQIQILHLINLRESVEVKGAPLTLLNYIMYYNIVTYFISIE